MSNSIWLQQGTSHVENVELFCNKFVSHNNSYGIYKILNLILQVRLLHYTCTPFTLPSVSLQVLCIISLRLQILQMKYMVQDFLNSFGRINDNFVNALVVLEEKPIIIEWWASRVWEYNFAFFFFETQWKLMSYWRPCKHKHETRQRFSTYDFTHNFKVVVINSLFMQMTLWAVLQLPGTDRVRSSLQQLWLTHTLNSILNQFA